MVFRSRSSAWRRFIRPGVRHWLIEAPRRKSSAITRTLRLVLASLAAFSGTISDRTLQVVAADGGEQELKVGGQTRGSCEDGGKGILLRVTPELRSLTVWKDDDAFPSNIQSVATSRDEILFAVKRQRPIGVRRLGAATPEVTTNAGATAAMNCLNSRFSSFVLMEMPSRSTTPPSG
jgi:hypothetical protein